MAESYRAGGHLRMGEHDYSFFCVLRDGMYRWEVPESGASGHAPDFPEAFEDLLFELTRLVNEGEELAREKRSHAAALVALAEARATLERVGALPTHWCKSDWGDPRAGYCAEQCATDLEAALGPQESETTVQEQIGGSR